MKLRVQIRGLLIAAALALPITITVISVTASHVERYRSQSSAAEALINDAVQLRQIAVETVLFHEARAPAQWQRQTAHILTQLSNYPSDSSIEQGHIDKIRARMAQTQSVYSRFVTLAADVTELHPVPLDAAQEARTVTSLFVITQEILDTCDELIHLNSLSISAALNTLYWAISLLILAMAALTLFAWRLVNRGVLRPIGTIEQGTLRVGSGDYSHRLGLPEDDEIGALAAEFDRMTAHVEQTQQALQIETEHSRCAEQQAAHLAERLQFATLAGRVGIWEYAIDSGQLIWDEVMYTLYGIRADTFGGAYGVWRSGLHPDDQARCDAEITQAIASHNPFISTFRVVWPSGEVHWIRAVGTVQYGTDGTPLRMIGTNWDISEEKKADQAKAAFVSTVSHELRTPLTSISGALGLIVGGVLGAVPANMQPLLEIAHNNSLRLTNLINDLLDMEKIAAGKLHFEFKTQALMPLIEQALESTSAYAERLNVHFQLSQRCDELLVHVDGNRLQQVLANLLSNAAKFSPSGGSIEINVHDQESSVRVEVIDHGAGISSEFRPRIFEKFSQADASDTRKQEGTGLGLAISKELIERMHGRVDFISEPGQGACFYFELPHSELAVAAMAATSAAPTAPQ